ncbi:MAG TPA: helix-turn-helix domain-containing protein [Puia sp.]|nr:helix-turn-helix domain-containing protein [Puia sp.]
MTEQALKAIIQAGEGNQVEFKRNVNSDISKEVVAFANSSGGRIFVGIDDDGTIPGISLTNELKARVQTMARDCDPPVDVELEGFNNLLIIHVPEGANKPYRCTNGFYIRTGAACAKLSTQEIIEFIKSEGKVRFEELTVPAAAYPEVLDESAASRYFRLAGISGVIGTEELLVNLGVLVKNGSVLAFNNAGLLFFARNLGEILPHCVVTCLLYKGNSKVHILDRKSFSFDLLRNIDETLLFIERHLNLAYEIKESRRKEILEIPEFVLREAIVNAVAHRDYFEKGANVQVDIFDNRIEISNPGGLPKGLKPENFGKHSVARNSLVAALLHRCNYIEKAGTGIQRMREGMKEAGLLEPTFEFSGFFTVTLRRFNLSKDIMLEFSLNNKRADRVVAILRQLIVHQTLDVEGIAGDLSTSSRTIRNDIDLLVAKGWVESSGATKGRNYSLTAAGHKWMSNRV